LPKNYHLTLSLGILLLAIALLPPNLFELALRAGVFVLALYMFYITKKILEIERGVRRAKEIGQMIERELKKRIRSSPSS